jgi:hypothetical protein
LMASLSDVWVGMMIGGFLLGGQTFTFQRPPGSSGANMSNTYPWYRADFVDIGLPPTWRESGCNIVAATCATVASRPASNAK